MKKNTFASALLCAAFLGAVLFAPAPAAARVRVDIHVALPPLFISVPPALVVIPGTPVYYPPAVGADIFLYNGYWYRPYQGSWFISGHFNGPWSFIAVESVPGVVITLPLRHHHVTPGHGPLPHRGFRNPWWIRERDRFFDHDGHRGDFRGNHGKGRHGGHGGRRGWDDD